MQTQPVTDTAPEALPILFSDREAWLHEAADMLIDDVILEHTTRPKPTLRLSCGFPKGSRGGRKVLGVCYPTKASADGVNEVFISPELAEPLRVLDILSHELIHAMLDCAGGHRGEFGRIARAIGLEGPLTETHAGEALTSQFYDVLTIIGGYPHAPLTQGRKKDSTRQRKCQCVACDLIVRMSASAMAHVMAESESNSTGWCPAGCGLLLALDV